MTARQYVIPTRPNMGRGLVNHDEKSKNYRAVSLVREGREPRTKTWRRGGAYDQNGFPHCVAFTGKGVLNTSPASAWVKYWIRSKYSTDDMYFGSQRHDQWHGEAYDGTSGLGLCRYLLSVNLIKEYRHVFSLEDYLLTLSWVGPIAFGTWWKSSMWNTDSNGFLRVDGRNEGGHEVELFGVNMEREYVEGMNSWSPSWGDRGRFKLSFSDLDKLRQEDADGFVITR